MNNSDIHFRDADTIEGVIFNRPRRFKDERGWLMEFFRRDEMHEGLLPAMGYLSVTLPGEKRGPHEHFDQTDIFVFPGPGDFLVALWDNRRASPTFGNRMTLVCGEGEAGTVIIPPGVVHGYCCISKNPGTCINVPNRLYRGTGKSMPVDEIRYENDPVSPFNEDFSRIIEGHFS